MHKNVDVKGLLKREQELQSQIDQMLGMQQPFQPLTKYEEEKEEQRQREEEESRKPKGMWDKFVDFVKTSGPFKDKEEERNRPNLTQP